MLDGKETCMCVKETYIYVKEYTRWKRDVHVCKRDLHLRKRVYSMKTREVREVSVSLVREMTTVKRDVYTSLLMCVKEAYIRHMYVC